MDVRHRKGQIAERPDGEAGAIGRDVASDEGSDNRRGNADKLCSNCNNMS